MGADGNLMLAQEVEKVPEDYSGSKKRESNDQMRSTIPYV